MKRKPIRVDWEELESAFDSGNEELVYYLDSVTGHVLLEGEGEEDDFDDDGGAPRPDDITHVHIAPLTTAQKIDWVRRFLDESVDLDPEFSASLKEALAADNAKEAITEVLHQYPEGSDRWYLYRVDRLREVIEDWLEANGVATVDQPPWKSLPAEDQP
jgi:hypothetical protein